MKKALTICLAGVAMAATLSLVAAGSSKREAAPADAQSSDEIAVAAADDVYAPAYRGVARIIHVPQRDERSERTRINHRDARAAIGNDDDESPPPPRQRSKPRWPLRSEAPPSGPRRAVLSAPPPPAEGPTPIRPTPRFGLKSDPADKFSAPRDTAAAPQASPPVDETPTPPAN